MNNELVPFKFENKRVRVVEIDGDPWFAAVDVCRILGLGNSRQAVAKFPKNEVNRGCKRSAITAVF
jgi:prophage antirepressor-like protein